MPSIRRAFAHLIFLASPVRHDYAVASPWQIVVEAVQELNGNTFVSLCLGRAKGGQWQIALTLIGSMLQASLAADVITYNTAINACEKAGQWQLALSLLEHMPQITRWHRRQEHGQAEEFPAFGG